MRPVTIFACAIISFSLPPTGQAADSAEDILTATGTTGGLIVHIGCNDGRLTAALRLNDSYLVHGLDADADNVARARDYLKAQGVYGDVSVMQWSGDRLPYADNLVNLLVADKLGGVTMDEVMRVLAPLGVAYVGDEKIVKPWPKEIDEWTHFLHGADNNAVAKDSVVGPPKRYQWISGPRWARSHDHLSSLSAMVSTKGRIFYIIDEAPVASVAFEPEWRLIARDAFSGVLLWKRKVEPWEGHFRPFRTGPTALARRLVAVGDRVFVTLGYGKPINILDAATGKTVQTCRGTDNAMEIAVDGGAVFAVVGDRAPFEREDTGRMSVEEEKAFIETWSPETHWKVWREKAPLKHLVANDAETGKLLWKKDDADTREIMPSAMAVSDGRVFVQNEKGIVALDTGTGKEIWRSERPINLHSPGSSSPTLVAVNGVVMLITAAPVDHAVHALAAESGELMWSFTAGGAVDSPPTIYQGTVIFGCADGAIYCLRATDGALAWRYRAAPVDRRIVAYGKVESVWPLHGSVLVQDGVVYAAAGRTTHMDGLFFHALDASTGQSLAEKEITQASFPDVLASDGNSIFMRQLRLDERGAVQPGNVPHLFSAAGFLDDTWWHRTYWQFGTGMPGGYTRWFAAGQRRPAGRLLVMDQERIYGFGRLNQYDHVGSHVGLGKMQYLLYAANRSDYGADATAANRKRLPWSAKKPDIPTLWKGKIDLLARGMVLCGKVLFVAGPPDLFGVAPGDTPHPYSRASAESLQAQREALDGKRGSLLWAVSAVDGRKLSEQKLDGLPAWDGLIAARGRLFLTMQDGTVKCLGSESTVTK